MRVTGGRVVLTRGHEQAYKVVLQYEWGEQSEHPAATIRQGEELIRSRLSPPPADQLDKLRQSPGDTTALCLVASQPTVPELIVSNAETEEPFADDGSEGA